MNEYQFYEFQAVDRPLDERAMAALWSITSCATITPTSLVNVYHWGDFKGDPDRLMDQYFTQVALGPSSASASPRCSTPTPAARPG